MADPISLATSIISIVSTTATFSARLQNAAQQFGDSNPELQRQLEDISVLLAVLQECKSLFVSGVQIPLAAEGAMKACASRHNNLFTVMNRIERCHSRRRSAIFGFLQVPRMITLEGDRRSAFHAFRDSVLLLRDLISEVRLNQQLRDMSAGIAQIMSEYSEDLEEPGKDCEDSHPEHPDQHEIFTDESRHDPSNVKSHTTSRPKYKAAMHELSELIKTNFTRDIRLIIPISAEQTPWQFKYVPARAKLDTGCEENLVSLEFLKSNEVQQSLLKIIPEDHEIALDGLDSTCVPEFEIRLSWYQGNELKMRKSKFLVVRDPPFDILIGTKRFVHDFTTDFRMPNPVLVIARRSKTRDEIAIACAKRQQARQEAKELEMTELAKFAQECMSQPGNFEDAPDGAMVKEGQSGQNSETMSSSAEMTGSPGANNAG